MLYINLYIYIYIKQRFVIPVKKKKAFAAILYSMSFVADIYCTADMYCTARGSFKIQKSKCSST